MKVAVVTDSNSGITGEQAKELGIQVLPMPFMIDNESYLEGVDLTQEEFYRQMEAGKDIRTSQPSPQAVTELWDQLLKEYDQVVHIPMSSALSSSCATARLLSHDYDGRVEVVDNHRISVTQRQSALDALELAKQGMQARDIRELLERTASQSVIYITVDTLKYLKKGGRITPAAAALGTLLKIKPILCIDGGRLDAFSKTRTMKQAKTIMMDAIARDLESRFQDPRAETMQLQIAYTCGQEAAEEFAEAVRSRYPQVPLYTDRLSLSIACHIGPGALALACTRKLEELE